MCKASQYASRIVEAQKGQLLGIGISQHGLAALHPHGQNAADCITCAKTGDTLTLTRIPLDLQQRFGIRAREVATFVQTDHNRQDSLRLQDGTEVPLNVLANRGIGVYMGELEDLGAPSIDAELESSAPAKEIVRV